MMSEEVGCNVHMRQDGLPVKALNSQSVCHSAPGPFGNDSKTEQVGHGVTVPATQEPEAGGGCEPNLGNSVRPCVFKTLGRVSTIQEPQRCGFLGSFTTAHRAGMVAPASNLNTWGRRNVSSEADITWSVQIQPGLMISWRVDSAVKNTCYFY